MLPCSRSKNYYTTSKDSILFLGFLLSQIEVSNFVLECCEEIEIAPSSPTDIFTNFNGFGIGTYKKDGIDARGRMIYRNSEHDFHVYGLGDFILMYEEPNEGGRQNWKVRMHLNMLCMHCNSFIFHPCFYAYFLIEGIFGVISRRKQL